MELRGTYRHPRRLLAAISVGGVMAMLARPLPAMDFELDNGARVLWTTNLSASAMWRAENPAPDLVGGLDRRGAVGNEAQDDGNLNYAKGDLVSAPVKVISDVEVRYRDYGFLVRGRAWYDYAGETHSVAHGSFVNGYQAGARLDDSGYNTDAKLKGLRLLDAYAYGRFSLGDMPLDVRLGRQVVNWGESLYFLGVNQTTPIDVAAIHKPGQQLKEVLRPTEMAYFNLGMTRGGSFEGFVQFKWQPYVLDGCGTYFSSVDIGGDPGCGATLNGLLPRWQAAGTPDLSAVMNDRVFYQNGWNLPRRADEKPGSGGQYGLSLRQAVEAIDSEVGLYYMNLHSKTPIVSGHTIKPLDENTLPRIATVTTQCMNSAAAAGMDTTTANNLCIGGAGSGSYGGIVAAGGTLSLGLGPLIGLLGTADYFLEYPKNIKLSGATVATNIRGWSVGLDLSVQRDFPVQLNVPDMVHAMALHDGPLASRVDATTNGGGITQAIGFWMPSHQGVMAGYDRKTKSQFDLSAVRLINSFAGAQSGTFIAEVAIQHLDIPAPSIDGIRYGRGFHWGHVFGASSLGQTMSASGSGTAKKCEDVKGWTDGNTLAMCSLDGFFTPWSWGYRLFWQLAYNTSSGLVLKPSVFWAHDVKGSSADYQLVDRRKQLGLTLRGEYLARYYAEVGYNKWLNDATYDSTRDRDFYSALVGMTF